MFETPDASPTWLDDTEAVAADEAPDSKVIDLMDALKRSLGQKGEAALQKRPRAANRNKPSPKPAGRRKRVA